MYKVKAYSPQGNLIHTSNNFNSLQEAAALAIFYCNVADAVPRLLKGRTYEIVDDDGKVLLKYAAE